MRFLSSFVSTPQGVIFLAALAGGLVLSLFNPAFFSVATLIDLLRNSLVTAIFALGVMMVLASGGIDVSCTAIGVFALYATVKIVMALGGGVPIGFYFVIAAAIGAGLGVINGCLVGGLGLPTLIVTLGTMSIFRGLLLTFVGTVYITSLPREAFNFSRTVLVRIENNLGQMVSLPMSFLVLVGVTIFVAIFMNLTRFGRQIYAIGGAEEAAMRIGIRIGVTKFVVYILAGMIAGLAGITHMTLARMANPFDLVGMELNVIAAVVLGGARITGGHGTVTGALLGAFVITMINTTLLMAGVPSYWQNVVIGWLILVGTGLPITIERIRGHRMRLKRPLINVKS